MDEKQKSRMRLDVRLQGDYPDVSRAQLQRFIKEGAVSVNGGVVRISKRLIKNRDIVMLDTAATIDQPVETIDLPIIYEDDDCVVIDKPIGLLSHSKGAYNPEATVATWLQQKLEDGRWKVEDKIEKNIPNSQFLIPNSSRTGIVHRLDRATSGVMICARSPDALIWLQEQFSTRHVKKTYIALIQGKLDPIEAIIDMPIERNPASPQRFRVGINGKPSTTHYKTIKDIQVRDNEYSLLELTPATGRTHQLRVHLAYYGHPIIGDTFYDGQAADRLYLHAARLELTLLNGMRKVFNSELPASFLEYNK